MRTANDFTDELFEAVEPCSAQAKALVYVMLHWTNQLPPDRRGYLERDGRPISREELARMASTPSPGGSAPDPFQELKAVAVLKQDGRTYYLPHVVGLARFRRGRAKSTDARRKKRRVSRRGRDEADAAARYARAVAKADAETFRRVLDDAREFGAMISNAA